jgi:hypothetical protein
VISDFKEIFGLEVCFIDKGVAVFGLENSLMPVGNNFIEVVAPTKPDTAAGRYLKRRNGDGGYMVICQCDAHETQMRRTSPKVIGNRRAAPDGPKRAAPRSSARTRRSNCSRPIQKD